MVEFSCFSCTGVTADIPPVAQEQLKAVISGSADSANEITSERVLSASPPCQSNKCLIYPGSTLGKNWDFTQELAPDSDGS